MILPSNIMLLYLVLNLLLFSIFFITLIDAASCKQDCSSFNVPYPFGFSSSCGIQLNCSHGDIMIGEYGIKNITADHILVNLPTNCSRGLNELEKFSSRNFAVTSRNNLLLRNCSSPPSNCMIPSNLLKGCDSLVPGSDNITCYSNSNSDFNPDDGDKSWFINYQSVRNNCNVLLSSIVVDMDRYNLNKSISEVAMEFQTVELGWWLVGKCDCDINADCRSMVVPGGGNGYSCRCKEGFIGDGFAPGGGCRRDECTALRYMSGKCGGTTRVFVLIGGIIIGALLMVVFGVAVYCVRRRSKSFKNRSNAKRFLSEATGNSMVPVFPYREIERATNSFSEEKRLGTGAYGTVYSGKLHNNELVAIKKIKHRDPESVQQVMNEINLLSTVSHPNLVRLLGCCIEHGEQILVYEFMANGTLSQHLQKERGLGLPWTVRLNIAAQTARAIAHLHNATNPPIYHRDVKSSNILLDYNFNSKVADFGLSRFGMMDDSHISTAPQGTPGYVDPQYHQNYHLSDKSDVYSFGVVLVEIITALKVVDFSRPHSEINLAALAIDRIGKGLVDEIIDPFIDPNMDAWTLSSIHRVAELAFRCLAFHRDMRPPMMEVAAELEQIRLSGWAPLEENIGLGSSRVSTCSSYNGSGISLSSTFSKKADIGSRRSIFSSRAEDSLPKMEESPVSIQEGWLSEQSSPSTTSLLGNVIGF